MARKRFRSIGCVVLDFEMQQFSSFQYRVGVMCQNHARDPFYKELLKASL